MLLALLQRYETKWNPNPDAAPHQAPNATQDGGGPNPGEPRVCLYMTLVPNAVSVSFTKTPEYAAFAG